MDTTTVSQLDISQLRKVIAKALLLPDEAVISGWLPENSQIDGFITVDLVRSREIGQAKRFFDGNNEQETVCATLLSTMAISAYGNKGIATCEKLRVLFQSSRLIDSLRAMNAHIVQISEVRNLTATVGAEYEERGQLEIEISHHHCVELPLEKINLAETVIYAK